MARSLTRQNRAGWLFAGPAFGLILLFVIVPFLLAFAFSLTNQRLISPNRAEYVGLRNFERLFGMAILSIEPEQTEDGAILRDEQGQPVYPRLREWTRDRENFPQYYRKREWFHLDWGESRTYLLATDVLFMKALINTLLFVAIVSPVQAGFALFLALLINMPLRGINFFRTIYFMPVVISMVVVSMLWRFIYDGQNGLLNALAQFFTFGGFQPVDWLGNTATALPAIMAMSVWQGVGFHMVIWLAGLQTIPVVLYEAGRIEGASKWQTFRYITWPGLRNTAILVMVIITMQAFTLFSQIQIMTQGGPLDSTQSLVYQMVVRGYEKQDIAGGSAISVFLFLLVLSISLVQRYLTRERSR